MSCFSQCAENTAKNVLKYADLLSSKLHLVKKKIENTDIDKELTQDFDTTHSLPWPGNDIH